MKFLNLTRRICQILKILPFNWLFITSPPYPMIQMWDDIMVQQNPEIEQSLLKNNGRETFELMHQELDKIWKEIHRIIIPGGFVCINIGDATRSINKQFELYPNHARIIKIFNELGFENLPNIIWRKPINSPNKFMGSGMLPGGAYISLEHEYILIFRKNGRRKFNKEEILNRQKSAYFWEERNQWFSDMWTFRGTRQLKETLDRRTAAYPVELPFRLINMFSLIGDTVVDPFLGTGTTTAAAIINGRNSIGYEIDEQFTQFAKNTILNLSPMYFNNFIHDRIKNHVNFIENRKFLNKTFKYYNKFLQLDVISKQEINIEFNLIKSIGFKDKIIVEYEKYT